MWPRALSSLLVVAMAVGVGEAVGSSEIQEPTCGGPSPVSMVQSPAPAAPLPPAPGTLLSTDRVGYPQGYRSSFSQFYVFDRFDARSISFVCAKEIATRVQPGQPYPYGSILVFESWRPVVDANDNLVLDAGGHLIRSRLSGIFVMRKEQGSERGTATPARESGSTCRSVRMERTRVHPKTRPIALLAMVPERPPRGTNVLPNERPPAPGTVRSIRRDTRRRGGDHADGISSFHRTIPVGTTVVWRNSTIDQTPHAVTATGGRSARTCSAPVRPSVIPSRRRAATSTGAPSIRIRSRGHRSDRLRFSEAL